MIYLDHNATTTIRPEVIDLVTSIMIETGNASATHCAGQTASMHIERAREQMALAVNTRPAQVIFTSCATESMNTILKTFKGERILASAIEHAAILDCGHAEMEIIPVTTDGIIDLEKMESMLQTSPVALVNMPQGVGCFVFAAQKPIRPLLVGGKQEKRQRAGTSNVAGIAGMGLAAELAVKNIDRYNELVQWRDDIESQITRQINSAFVNGQNAPRVGNTISLTCPDITNTVQMLNLDLEKICVSGGSACSSGIAKPSHVLTAMGLSDEDALATLRISMGWNTTREEMDEFVASYIGMDC